VNHLASFALHQRRQAVAGWERDAAPVLGDRIGRLPRPESGAPRRSDASSARIWNSAGGKHAAGLVRRPDRPRGPDSQSVLLAR